MKDLTYLPKHPDLNGWKPRHLAAIASGHPVAKAIQSWLDYATRHKRTFDSKIGDDYVLGDAWAEWGFALRRLLNGDLGQMDGGTLDAILVDNLTEQGWNCDLEQRSE